MERPPKRSDPMPAVTARRRALRPAAGKPGVPAPERPFRILLAADSAGNRFLIRSYLKRTPYRLDDAEYGAIAVDKFKHRRYDLVLIDIHMPLVDGYCAVREMRRWETEQGLPGTPFVALTASAFAEDRQQALSAGCDDHISKPVSKSTLLDAIRAWNSTVDPKAVAELRECDAPDEPALLRTLIDQFLSDLDPRLTAIRKAVSGGDANNLHGTAHALKGSCSHFGAHRMARLCSYLERDGRAEMDSKSHEVVAELEIEAKHVRLALAAEREKASEVVSSSTGSDEKIKTTQSTKHGKVARN